MINEKTLRKNIGKKIKISRTNQKLTQAQLAEKAGLTDKYIYQIESAAENISLTTLIKIANVLNEDLDYFIGSGNVDQMTAKLKILPKKFQLVVEDLIDNLLEALSL